MRRRWLVLPVLAFAVAGLAVAAQERAGAQDRADQGRRMFMEQGCHGCHTIGKMGTPIGPDLSYMGAKRSEEYLKSWLRDPASQRPSAHMPRLELTEPQIAALAAFLASLK
jgi:cytochrome c oxidase subunit II